jgi:hypothetical protein
LSGVWTSFQHWLIETTEDFDLADEIRKLAVKNEKADGFYRSTVNVKKFWWDNWRRPPRSKKR